MDCTALQCGALLNSALSCIALHCTATALLMHYTVVHCSALLVLPTKVMRGSGQLGLNLGQDLGAWYTAYIQCIQFIIEHYFIHLVF